MCMSCFLSRWPKRTCAIYYTYIRRLVTPWLSVCPENVLQIHFTSLVRWWWWCGCCFWLVRRHVILMAYVQEHGWYGWIPIHQHTNHRGKATSSQEKLFSSLWRYMHVYIYFRGIFTLLRTFNAHYGEQRCLCVYFIITFILQVGYNIYWS